MIVDSRRLEIPQTVIASRLSGRLSLQATGLHPWLMAFMPSALSSGRGVRPLKALDVGWESSKL